MRLGHHFGADKISTANRERRLKNDCKILESRASRYKEIIPLCEQLLPLGIGFAELSAFHAAIFRKMEVETVKSLFMVCIFLRYMYICLSKSGILYPLFAIDSRECLKSVYSRKNSAVIMPVIVIA